MLVGIVLLVYLIPLVPVIYTKTMGTIMPVSGYSFISYYSDSSYDSLYWSVICFIFYLIVAGFSFLIGCSSFFTMNDTTKRKIFFAYGVMSIIGLASSIAMTVLVYLCSASNIHVNLGCYLIIGVELIQLVYAIISFVYMSKIVKSTKNKAV